MGYKYKNFAILTNEVFLLFAVNNSVQQHLAWSFVKWKFLK